MTDCGLRSQPARTDRSRLMMKKPSARNAVLRVSTFAVPRLDRKPPPPPPPMPSPPPSDFCNRMTPIIAVTTMRRMTMSTVRMSPPRQCFARNQQVPVPGRHIGSRRGVYSIPAAISMAAARSLFRLDPRVLDPPGPLGEVLAHEGVQLLGRARERVEADGGQPLLDLWIGDDPRQLGVETRDHRPGGMGGREHGIPRDEVERGEPGLRHGGDLWEQRAALPGGDRERAHIAGPGLWRTEGEVDEHHRQAPGHHVVDGLG